jgi:anti-anti-sigma factor
LRDERLRAADAAASLPRRMHLDISVDRRPTATVVTLSGELDLATATRLDRELDGITADDLVLDMRAVTYLDSTGVSLLLRRDAAARGAGRRLQIVGGETTRQVFAITQVDRLLQLAG